MTSEHEKLIKAAKQADWGQVMANGGPPCFHLMENGRLCFRAKRWIGHDENQAHEFVSLADLIRDTRAAAQEENDGVGTAL